VVAHRGVPRCVSRRFNKSVFQWCGGWLLSADARAIVLALASR
jgi:hypothetical protein